MSGIFIIEVGALNARGNPPARFADGTTLSGIYVYVKLVRHLKKKARL